MKPRILIQLLTVLLLFACADSSTWRTIKQVDDVSVETPAGTVPRLPWQLKVTYSDGSSEFRQVVWNNYPAETEKDQADAGKHPAGSSYTVQGFIVGDNTTSSGYPVQATVKVTDSEWGVPGKVPVAEPLPLGSVRLIGDNRLTSNRDLDIRALLALDVTQQLYNYRDTYGLSTEGYTESDGWDSPHTKLKGHGTGHYLSALAFAYAGTDDPELRRELLSRIRRMVNEMRECQELTFVWDEKLGRYREARDLAPEDELMKLEGTWQAFDKYKKDYRSYGYGYLNAIPAQHAVLIEKYAAYNNESGVWAPYYTIHKQLAGLIDIAKNVDDRELADKALLIAHDMGLWVWNRLHYRTYEKSDGTRAERMARPGNRYEMWNMYIAGEVGGMAESLSRLAEMADNDTDRERFIEAASYFDSPAFFDPLSRNIDDIRTRHANQHIPMITGALRSYRTNADPYYYNLAYNFWNLVQGRYAYAMGGVGNGEMFRQPYTQILSMNTNVMSDYRRNIYPNPNINETCCAYNLAKLTKDLNCFDPDNAVYMDYYERVLYNQIVGSVHPDHYSVTYQYAVGMNAYKPWGNETPQESCCGGTGAENHVKYQEAAYFVSDNCMWVALYLPTEARWDKKGVSFRQECSWPAESSAITITEGSGTFSLKLRVPYWATNGFTVKLNGRTVARKCNPCSYVEIAERTWKKGDHVEISMPFSKHLCWGPDKMDLAATGRGQTNTPFSPQWVGTLMYGPLVMATRDITSWDDADFDITANLSEVEVEHAQVKEGTYGNLYTLKFQGHTFEPDYWQKENSTHYLRLNVLSGKPESSSGSTRIEYITLKQTVKEAQERIDAQNAWNAMEQKTPAFAPWAKHGYARMVEKKAAAESLIDKAHSQQEIDDAVSALKAAMAVMRPGNLAEPEDLDNLLTLVTDSKENIPNKTTALREAIDYADMVIQYVNDGSGTTDMIENALKRLNAALDAMKQ